MQLQILAPDDGGPPIYYEDFCGEPKSPLHSCRIKRSKNESFGPPSVYDARTVSTQDSRGPNRDGLDNVFEEEAPLSPLVLDEFVAKLSRRCLALNCPVCGGLAALDRSPLREQPPAPSDTTKGSSAKESMATTSDSDTCTSPHSAETSQHIEASPRAPTAARARRGRITVKPQVIAKALSPIISSYLTTTNSSSIFSSSSEPNFCPTTTRIVSTRAKQDLTAPNSYCNESNLQLYEQSVELSPWLNNDGETNGGCCETMEWCQDIEKFLLPEEVDKQTTFLLMKEAEFQDRPNIQAQLMPAGARDTFYSSHLLRASGRSVSSYRGSFFDQREAPGLRYHVISHGHFKRVLGRNRYLRIRMGITIWAFFQNSSTLDVYRFYLSDQGEFKLQKQLRSSSSFVAAAITSNGALRPGVQGLSDVKPATSWSTWFKSLYHRRIQLKREQKSIGGGEELLLEKLRVIDISRPIRDLLSEPKLKKIGASAIAGFWNEQHPEPLIVASDRQSDIDDIIFVIRFTQHYKGLRLALIQS